MKTIIGITGKIGAGKSTIVKYLASNPAVDVFDCDEEVREIYDDPDIVQKLQHAFGTSNRKEICDILIEKQDVNQLQILKDIFADVINTRFLQWVHQRKGIIVIDAPLLFENDMDLLCDITIQISVPQHIRKDRTFDRTDSMNALFQMMDVFQMNEETREQRADYVVDNYNPIELSLLKVNTIIGPLLPKIAIYAGSFDPITKGHVDIIEKAAHMFDILVVAVGVNPDKKHTLNSQTRMELVEYETSHISNVSIECYSDTLLAVARRTRAKHIVRGIRNEADVITEMNMSGVHNAADPSIQTIFVPTDPKYQYISSSAAKILLQSHRSPNPNDVVDVSWMISDTVKHKLLAQQIHDYNNANSTSTLT